MGESMLHVDEICCGLKKAEVSNKGGSFSGYLVLNWAVQTGFTQGRLSTLSPTMSSYKHSSSI